MESQGRGGDGVIKVRVVDREALRRITPERLREYLEAHGWASGAGGYVDKVTHDWGSCAFWVPRAGCIDYDLRMYDALGALERDEGRSQLEIYCELVGEPVEVALGIDVEHKITISKN
jgi:hypothetical protein